MIYLHDDFTPLYARVTVRAIIQALPAVTLVRLAFLALVVTTTPVLHVSSVDAQITLRTVALSGDTAPGTAEAKFKFTINPNDTLGPVINNSDRTAFNGRLQLGGPINSLNDTGIWSEGLGGLSLVARESLLAPDTAGGTFSGLLNGVVLNDRGHVAFFANLQLDGPITFLNNQGIWSNPTGALDLVAQKGNVAPDTTGFQFSFNAFSRPVLNDAGQTAFVANAGGVGLWSEGTSTLRKVARSGDVAPGSGGASFANFGIAKSPAINNTGRTAFVGKLATGANVTTQNDGGIWFGDVNNLTLVAREGDVAPGTGGLTFAFIEVNDIGPVINSAGNIAFRSAVFSGGFVDGIWTDSSGTLAPVALATEVAPGAGGRTFQGLRDPSMNASGQVAFAASLNDGQTGIWSNGSGSLALLMLKFTLPPGTSGNTFFDSYFDVPAINAAGDTAFLAKLTGNDVNSGNDFGIWAEGPGGLALVAREGSLVEVAPGDFRRISVLDFVGGSGNDDGRVSAFNDRGGVAFGASFTDGSSGIFVASTFVHGVDQEHPILPTDFSPNPDGSWNFDGVSGDGQWFDPVAASGYVYATDGLSNFTDVGLPTGLGDLDGFYTITDGVNPLAVVAEGASHTFLTPVDQFTITGINPTVDGEDPLAFPTFLAFDQTTVSFTMTPIPEPASVLLAALSLVALVAFSRRIRFTSLPNEMRRCRTVRGKLLFATRRRS